MIRNLRMGDIVPDKVIFSKDVELETDTEYAYLRFLNRRFKTVILPDKLKKIDNSAFSRCKALKAVRWPLNLEIIGDSAFEKCSDLKRLVFPETLRIVEDSAFYECYSLDTVIFQDGLEEIGSFAFSGCWYLKTLVLPDSVVSIGEGAFARCNSVTIYTKKDSPAWERLTELGYGEHLADITDYIYEPPKEIITANQNTETKTSTLAENETDDIYASQLPDKARNLIGVWKETQGGVYCPANIVITENSIHWYNKDYEIKFLKDANEFDMINERGSVEIRFDWSFDSDNNLQLHWQTEAEGIDDGYLQIYATFIEAGESLATETEDTGSLISEQDKAAQESTEELATDPQENAEEPETKGDYNWELLPDGTAQYITYTYIDTDGMETTQRAYIGKSVDHLIIPSVQGGYSVSSIGPGAFEFVFDTDWNSITKKVTVPEGITEILQYGFNYATSVEEFVLPESLRIIGSYAFQSCRALRRINLPSGIIAIDDTAFIDCPNLIAVVEQGSNPELYCIANGIPYTYDLESDEIIRPEKTAAAPASSTEMAEPAESATVSVRLPVPGENQRSYVIPQETQTTSYIQGRDASAYTPDKMTDGIEETAWQFSTKDSKLKETYVYFQFPEPIEIDELWIKNGFWRITKGLDQYTRNSRVREMDVSFKYVGSEEFTDQQTVKLKDDKKRKDWQKISLGHHQQVVAVQFRINKIYKGTKFPKDVCISEVMFVRNDQ